MASESVGNAYLNVVPKVDGDSKSLGNKFGSDFSSGASSALSAGAVALGNILSDVITSVASSAGEELSKAFWNYADYEQLVGGVDTLFKGASQTVQENAKEAFKTAGLSANEYMENVTSFSASLISSLGGDTAKAAEVADKAIVDMSDNANKMGSDMESITTAYQGFAKQNYTMLDNLKLGYGGTKSEMERLLKDASELAGVQFNIDSYADVIEAIHVIQESMDITGTTMKEGSTTISGSINQLKGAWNNFLTAVGDGGQTMDLSKVTDDLIESLGAVASNIVPAIQRIGGTIATELPKIISDALGKLVPTVREGIVNAFGENAGVAFDTFIETVGKVKDSVMNAADTFKDTFMPVLDSVKQFVLDHVVPAFSDFAVFIADTVIPDVMSLVGWFTENLGPVFEWVATIILDTVVPAIKSMYNWFKENILPIIKAVAEFVTQTLVPAFMDIADWIGDNVIPVLKDLWDWMDENIVPIFKDLAKAIETVIGWIKDFIDNISSAIDSANEFNAANSTYSTSDADPWSSGYYGYATGGFTTGNGLYRAGERGRELVWPSYEPYISQYADAIADSMGGAGGVDIHDCTFNVREESDIRKVANELNRLINRQTAGAVA